MPGKIVDARAHVRITRRSFVRLSASIFSCSLASMYGPFLDDLDTKCLLAYFRFVVRRRTIIGSVRLLFRVRACTGFPHLVFGCPPIGALPSPPPCGWSRGFITDPRTVGRRPSHRLRPALPMLSVACSELPTWPIVAMQDAWTRRTSPLGRRTWHHSSSFAI